MRIQSKIDTLGIYDSFYSQELTANATLSLQLARQESMLRDKSSICWLREGDRNSKFFHSLLARHRAQDGIGSLLIDGVLVQDQNVIEDHVVNYFLTFFLLVLLQLII